MDVESARNEREFQIEIQGVKRKALILDQAAYDPINEKLRS